MVFSNLKNRFLIVFCLFVVILPFFLITFTYATEDVDYNLVTNDHFVISSDGLLVYVDNAKSYFLELEKGYIYTITLSTSNGQEIRTGFLNDLSVSSTVYNYNRVSSTYTLTINSDDYSYFYFGFQNYQYASDIDYTITKEPSINMNSTVSKLVDNVGINSIWNIFDISINYIVVVVLVAFGIFIITRIIKKISKGKEGL